MTNQQTIDRRLKEFIEDNGFDRKLDRGKNNLNRTIGTDFFWLEDSVPNTDESVLQMKEMIEKACRKFDLPKYHTITKDVRHGNIYKISISWPIGILIGETTVEIEDFKFKYDHPVLWKTTGIPVAGKWYAPDVYKQSFNCYELGLIRLNLANKGTLFIRCLPVTLQERYEAI
jgi:hypothetical protein